MKILVTRPQTNAGATIEALAALGHDVLHEPLLRVETIDTPLPDGPFSDIIITSVNAVPALDRAWQTARATIAVFTTGEATAQVVRNAGFTNCTPVEGSALSLVKALPGMTGNHTATTRLLYPCAEETAHDIARLLAAQGIECISWPCYRTMEAMHFSGAMQSAMEAGEIDCVLLYSAKTARNYACLMDAAGFQSPPILTLSREISLAMPGTLQALCRFPDVPSENELLKLLPKQSN